MRVLLLGHHNAGAYCLRKLIAKGYNVVGVVAHKESDTELIWYHSVERFARKSGLITYTPDDINSPDFIEIIEKLKPDVIFSVYIRWILGERILKIPPKGYINLHPSLLPKYRGCFSNPWAIICGEEKTGVTLHYMDKGADTGDIIAQQEVEIEPGETGFTLYNKTTLAGSELFDKILPLIEKGIAPRIKQNHEEASFFWRKLPFDGIIDWSRPAVQLERFIRAITFRIPTLDLQERFIGMPHIYPGATTYLDGLSLMVWKASAISESSENASANYGEIIKIMPKRGFVVQTGDGSLLIEQVQVKNHLETFAHHFADEYNIRVGQRFEGNSWGQWLKANQTNFDLDSRR